MLRGKSHSIASGVRDEPRRQPPTSRTKSVVLVDDRISAVYDRPARSSAAPPVIHERSSLLSAAEKSTCYRYIQSRQHAALDFASKDGSVARALVKSKLGVDVFASPLHWEDVRATVRVNGTVKDVMKLLCSPTSDEFLANQRIIMGDHVVDAKVLDLIRSEGNFFHCGLKWMAVKGMIDHPHTFDFVSLDYTDVSRMDDDSWMGYRVVESIRLGVCPPKPEYSRASVRCEAYLVMETSTPHVVEVTYAAHIDWKAPGTSRPKLQAFHDHVIDRLINIRTYAESMRLAKLAIIGTEKWVRDTDRTECSVCTDTFRLMLRRHHCRMCGEVICRKCNTKVHVPTGLNDAKTCRVRVCFYCLMKSRETETDLLAPLNPREARLNGLVEATFLCPEMDD
ncbi:hypothetical protein SDRG_04079 [Saprolegnia diclina VS20]|uniref:FYVE-type domain-containing protein n=1 Tax=Saprolegnia diclina (strain VS20) TaxID=1156394 RepID=T0QWF3_SAPDV|nr:hypothetical protein SDRG_04079 [Saprolegnia diclina VS20]EQC38365.1 hypothetical protein SDRG_04079 [Saprolegnia diclina VS20]|eukprot:XP_008607957.1 hypothetical protein SDRG_04079 [Saprolegnia diclina VS20]